MTNSSAAVTVVEDREPYKAFNPLAPRLALKHGAAFLVTDTQGMIPGGRAQGFGLYREDTRWISRWNLTVLDETLKLVSADTNDGFAGRFTYGNAASTLTIERDLVINQGLTERVTIKNLSGETRDLQLVIQFASDFADMFEVRGTERPKRGETRAPRLTADRRRTTLTYVGLDRIRRRTFIDFIRPQPARLTADKAVFALRLKAGEVRELTFHVSMQLGRGAAPARPVVNHNQERAIADARLSGWMQNNARITTSNKKFNEVLTRAYGDIYSLRQENKHGHCLAAGVPWFAVPFGRDDFITALQTVRFMPYLAAEILEFFAHYQAKKFNEELDAEPGKMPHEIRTGEMANCAEIAFRPYYGTVDATQLWLMLISAYVAQTGDLDLPRRLWRHVRAAEAFLSRSTGNGATPIYYGGKPGQALSNTCWKDSGNSMVYADGSQPKNTRIAVCEAQGYLYSAWVGTAEVAELLGHVGYARKLRAKAALFKDNFERLFWMPDKQFVAMAVDGNGRQLDVISSNPGHLLGCGILSREAELKVAERLMREDMFSGWGIRTLSAFEKAYDPDDYQVGAVWPHDNGFAAAAMPAIGKSQSAHSIFSAMYDTALCHDDLRLPELFCGHTRVPEQPPVPYQVACVPQAWAAGCWFHMLSGMMNIEPDALNGRVRVVNPALPAWLGEVRVDGLRVGAAEVDLVFSTDESGMTSCWVRRQTGDIQVEIFTDR
ncbi:MAG TPA: glycogen debranching N-terminal domain-containing protein [Planktothrix sp.]|jgi:glycogen debranching enzyme